MRRILSCAFALCALSAAEASEKKIERKDLLAQANASYVARIKPIFEAKCFDCHSDRTNYPWYDKIPGVKQFIDHDIEEGREYLDLSRDFPFKGHGSDTIEKTLEEVGEVISDGEMPPWTYRVLHWGSGATADEAKAVLEWTRQSRELLLTGKKD